MNSETITNETIMEKRISIVDYLENSAAERPQNIAIIDPVRHSEITYRDLNTQSARVRDWLFSIDVKLGDRVGIYLDKSIESVIAIFGILKAGAAYIPVDTRGPLDRNFFILDDCSVSAIIIEDRHANRLKQEFDRQGKNLPPLFVVNRNDNFAFDKINDPANGQGHQLAGKNMEVHAHDLAYILYTSGSTGKPKGVMLTHGACASFITWCSDTFKPSQNDRLSSHAPFHFDLSILDIYLAIKHSASLVLIGEDIGKQPRELAQLIAKQKISIWYSTPSILSLLCQYGKLENHNYAALRYIFYAGEVFPIKQLRGLKKILPDPEYYNLYGPTETNVCTYYRNPSIIPDEVTSPLPIGRCCENLQAKVVDADGVTLSPGNMGELWISGPQLMQGYWGQAKMTDNALVGDSQGRIWYKTGDKVVEDAHGDYTYVGRLDRMVKRRGYRIELGEIESAIHRHEDIKEAAAIAHSSDDGLKIKVFVSSVKQRELSIIGLKKFATEVLSPYMTPDYFVVLKALPRTSTDKIDYQALESLA